MGRCQHHYDEWCARQRRREDALQLLHRWQVDGQALQSLQLRDELSRLDPWWRRACNVVAYQLPELLLPADEAEAATEWCIALAQELVDCERAARAGVKHNATMLDHTRQWVWERFANLETGLMSNGVPRRTADRSSRG